MHLSGSYTGGGDQGDLTPLSHRVTSPPSVGFGTALSPGGASPAMSMGTISSTTPVVTFKTYQTDQNIHRQEIRDELNKMWSEINRLRSELNVQRDLTVRYQTTIAQQSNIITKLSLGR